MQQFKSFASDNYSGVHPEIMQAINNVNCGPASAYGHDDYTKQAIELCKQHFGEQVDVYFVFNGTGANIVSLSALVNSYNAIICAESAHINVHECGATENFTGAKLLPVSTNNGKITIDGIKRHMQTLGLQHYVQPKVVSITQATEYGTVYTIDEIKAIADFAHAHDMYLHVDGARLSNAAAYLNIPLRAFTTDIGVDVISFGGTKNGMMFGEAVIFRDQNVSKNVKFIRDQATQLASKMRFLSAQFIAILSGNLWLENAKHANKMAKFLANELIQIEGITLTQPVQINSIFLAVPKEHLATLKDGCLFYTWDAEKSIIRLMTSWNTTELEIKEFIDFVKKVVK